MAAHEVAGVVDGLFRLEDPVAAAIHRSQRERFAVVGDGLPAGEGEGVDRVDPLLAVLAPMAAFGAEDDDGEVVGVPDPADLLDNVLGHHGIVLASGGVGDDRGEPRDLGLALLDGPHLPQARRRGPHVIPSSA